MNCLILCGSPRGQRSTSYSIAEYLRSLLDSHEVTCDIQILPGLESSDEFMTFILEKIERSSYVILTSPLYVDSLPSHVLKILMKIAYARTSKAGHTPKFVGIVNSGFPESEHNTLALRILELFCKQASFEWAGGLPFGGGGIVSGVSLDQLGGRGRNVRNALELLADSVIKEERVPERAVQVISKLGIPKKLYIMFAEKNWKKMAQSHGVLDRLDATPYVN